jgi:hypothetical protein
MGVHSYFCGTVEAVVKPYQSDDIDWDAGREGYVNSPTTYVPDQKHTDKLGSGWYLLSICGEERLGSLIAAAGTIWTTYVATVDYASLWHLQILPPGPIEVCALGILAWLHAKWRHSRRLD